MVSSISATERIKLWDQFDRHVDHETVKIEFMRKVHCKNPPFRLKLKPKQRHCAEIPPLVEFHYKNPPPLLPSLRDVLRCERVYRERGLPTVVNSEMIYNEIDKDLQELRHANKKVTEFEESIRAEKPSEPNIEYGLVDDAVEMNGLTETKELSEVEVIDNIVDSIPMESDEKIIEKIENKSSVNVNVKTVPLAMNGKNEENIDNIGIVEISDDENDSSQQQDNTFDANKLKANRKRKRNISTKSFGAEYDDLLELSEEVFKSKLLNGTNGVVTPETIDDQLDGIDVEVVKRLALAQLQQILKESPDLVTKYQHETANKAIKDALKAKPVKITLPSQLLSRDDIAKIAEQFVNNNTSSDEKEAHDPAYAGVGHPVAPLPQLTTEDEAYCYTNGFDHILNDQQRALAIARRLEKPLKASKVRARAVLTPVGDILSGKQWYTNSSVEDSIFMRYRNLVIGSGPGCDLQMKNVRKCARLSSHHATIFYDDVSAQRNYTQTNDFNSIY